MMSSSDKTYKETLIKGLKKEVKHIMEEAVTKKFVHEDSASITSLCGLPSITDYDPRKINLND